MSANILLVILSLSLTFTLGTSFVSLFPLPYFFLVPLFCVTLRGNSFRGRFVPVSAFGFLFAAISLVGAEAYGWTLYCGGVLSWTLPFVLLGVAVATVGRKALGLTQQALLVASAAVLIDSFSNVFLQSFPSPRLAGAFSFSPFWLQLAAYSGATGLTFVVVYSNMLFALLFSLDRRELSQQRKQAFFGLLIIFLLFGLQLLLGWRAGQLLPEQGKAIRFAAIQGSATLDEYRQFPFDEKIQTSIVERYEHLSKQAVTSGIEVLLWPEGTYYLQSPELRKRLMQFIASLPVPLIGGFIEGADNERNGVFQFNSEGEVVAQYFKNFPVPLAEQSVVQGEPQPLFSSIGTIASPICLEGFASEHVRHLVRTGGELIVIFTDEAGFGGSILARLIMNQTILRAVENDRYVIRVAQNGHSALIAPTGEVLAMSERLSQTFLPGEVYLRKNSSFYSQNGEWFSYVVTFVLTVFAWRTRQLASSLAESRRIPYK